MFSLAPLKNNNVRRIVASQMISQICDKLMVFSVMWVIADQYAAAWVSWYVVAGGLPHLLLAGISGRIVARIGVLASVVGTEIFRGLLLLIFPLLFKMSAPPIFALLGLAFLVNLGSALFNPAIMSLPLHVTDDDTRPQVNALIDSCFSVAYIIGPLMAVVLFAKLGLQGLFLLNGLSYLLAAIIQSTVKISTQKENLANLEEIKTVSSWIIIKREHLMRNMMITFMGVTSFGTPFLMLFPLYVKQVYHQDLSALATLQTSFGAGALTGAVLLSLLQLKNHLGLRIIGAILIDGLALIAFSLSTTVFLGSVAIFVMGLFLAMANVWIVSFFQSSVAAEEVPSVMSLVNLITVAATPLSLAVTALILEHYLVQQIALTSALAFLVIGSVLLFMPRLRAVQ